MKDSRRRWFGAYAAVVLALAAGCATSSADTQPTSNSACGFAAEVPCPTQTASAASAGQGAAPAAKEPTTPAKDPTAPQWPPAGMAVPASAPPPKRVEIGRLLPHAGCRELAQVTGSGGGGIWTSSATKTEKAYDEIRSSTRTLGGDYALIDLVAGDARGITITAHAYDCSVAPPAPAAGAGASVDERLRRLDQLKRDGLITPDEYATKRRAILDDL